MDSATFDDRRLTRRGVAIVAAIAASICFLQAPGRIAPDTKVDLAINPAGFVSRSLHLWSSQAPMGQVQNQAYGYLFPHGSLFLLGDVLAFPAWVTQRLWWALLVVIGVVGVIRLAEALGVGSRGSRIIAAIAFVISPRVLTTIGSISSETLPMMLAPWVLTPVVVALNHTNPPRSVARLALRSACAIALMGAVNAVATVAACGAAGVWWLIHARVGNTRWRRFTYWWVGGIAAACAWWIIPLLILSRVSPPFLDYIESSRATTRWTSLVEVLRGTSSWIPFVSPERIGGASLVSMPIAVIATGAVAAVGLGGLAMRSMPARGRLVTIAAIGLLLLCVGFDGQLGSPIANPVRDLLDGVGAPLRNVHKWEPLLRIPIVLGIAHALARVPLPPTVSLRQSIHSFSHPERSPIVGTAALALVALIGASSLVWTGSAAPEGTFSGIPPWWSQASQWLHDHGGTHAQPRRALVVPGSPFAYQTWGLTRDEPLQPLTSSPWAVRDAIPLTPPGTIRAMDAVTQQISTGYGSVGLAATLAQQGISYLVLRADLDTDKATSTRPLVAHAAIAASPGLTRVARFGPAVGPPTVKGVVGDDGLQPHMPAIEIYAVDAPAGFSGLGPHLVNLDAMPRVAGGPEVLARLDSHAAAEHSRWGTALLDADARRAGLGPAPIIATDTPANREANFGRVDYAKSAIRSADEPRRTNNAAPDYPINDTALTQGQWLLNGQRDEVSVSASSSASDATQLGQSSPANAPAAAFDADGATSWVSRDLNSAVGQWLQVDFTHPRSRLSGEITLGRSLGTAVSSLLISTEAGTTVMQNVSSRTPVHFSAPTGSTRWIQIRAIATEDGTSGSQFAISELSLTDAGAPLSISRQVALPDLSPNTRVSAWDLGQGTPSRSQCATGSDNGVHCSSGLAVAPEEPGTFRRMLSVPAPTSVRPRVWLRPAAGTSLDRLLDDPSAASATGPGSVTDPRGSASAVVDGDTATTWTGPDNSGTSNAATPSVRIRLPSPRMVNGLNIAVPQGQYPAHPRQIGVDLGTGRQVRTLNGSGHIDLAPRITDSITVSVIDATDLVDINSLGFATPAPTGISEVTPLPERNDVAAPDNRIITVACGSGPSMSVGNSTVDLSVTASARDLMQGKLVAATPCNTDRINMAAGHQGLTIVPSNAFTVDSASLSAVDERPFTAPQPIQPTRWDAQRRSVTVVPSSTPRVLVVAESVNPGWHARLNGEALQAITVNGWQQGWIVPAGVGGTVTATYPLDIPYRWSLLLGLIAVAALFILAHFPRRLPLVDTDDGPPPSMHNYPSWAALAAAASLGLLAGWIGLLLGLVSGAATLVISRRYPTAVPVVVAGAAWLGAIGLSWGPWASGEPYVGFDWWVSAPAVMGVAALLAWSVDSPILRRSRRRIAARIGSSISP